MDIGECYLILGLEQGASEEEIKAAYRKLAKQYHPDKTQGDEFLANMFKKIQTAYQTLSDGTRHSTSDHSKHSAPVYKDNPVLKQLIVDYQQAQLHVSDARYKLKSIQHSKKKQIPISLQPVEDIWGSHINGGVLLSRTTKE
mgnify:CR=1 FL=1